MSINNLKEIPIILLLVPKLQLGNGIATKVGQASSPDIIMTCLRATHRQASGDVCPTFALNQKKGFSDEIEP